MYMCMCMCMCMCYGQEIWMCVQIITQYMYMCKICQCFNIHIVQSQNHNILSLQMATSWLMNPYHPWKLARTWLFSLFSSMSELWATMGVREAQDGKPWLLLDDMRNLVQSVSREGTARRKWEGVVWAAMSVALFKAAAQAVSVHTQHVCVYVCVCVCVWERERERKRERMNVCVQGTEIYVHVHVCSYTHRTCIMHLLSAYLYIS